jgi:YD repeat-containing protein
LAASDRFAIAGRVLSELWRVPHRLGKEITMNNRARLPITLVLALALTVALSQVAQAGSWKRIKTVKDGSSMERTKSYEQDPNCGWLLPEEWAGPLQFYECSSSTMNYVARSIGYCSSAGVNMQGVLVAKRVWDNGDSWQSWRADPPPSGTWVIEAANGCWWSGIRAYWIVESFTPCESVDASGSISWHRDDTCFNNIPHVEVVTESNVPTYMKKVEWVYDDPDHSYLRAYWMSASPKTADFQREVHFNVSCHGSSNDCLVAAEGACTFELTPLPGTREFGPIWTPRFVCHPVIPAPNVSTGGGLNGGDPVDLVSGEHLCLPAPDIAVYNPKGPSVVYQRNYCSYMAKRGYGSPGLSVGWVDNFDVRIRQLSPAVQGWLRLHYPSGGEDMLEPVADEITGELECQFEPETGHYLCQLEEPTGAPYVALGVRDGNDPDEWMGFRITWSDGTTWEFSPGGLPGEFVLSKIRNRLDQAITILRSNGAPSQVVRDGGGTLLTFARSPDGKLASVTDCYGRKVMYGFEPDLPDRYGNLLRVSQIGASTDQTIADHWTYGYSEVEFHVYTDPEDQVFYGKAFHLTSVSFPSPTGQGATTQTIEYYCKDDGPFLCGRVKKVTDGNGNTSNYEYEEAMWPDAGSARVKIKSATGALESETLYRFESPTEQYGSYGTLYRRTPRLTSIERVKDESTSYATRFTYDDIHNPQRPTAVTDATGKWVNCTYDHYGNVLSLATPRTTTRYTYEYPTEHKPYVFPLGRLIQIQVENQEDAKTPTTISYYDSVQASKNLVQSITTPKPGTTDGSTVTTAFWYDYMKDPPGTLGNIWKVECPGNSIDPGTGVTRILTAVFDYGSDPKVGQPLTATDNLGHVTHFSYDAKGNVASLADALGNQTSFDYNIADQLLRVTYPTAGEGP